MAIEVSGRINYRLYFPMEMGNFVVTKPDFPLNNM
jgi:hypothetical protein